MRDGQKNSVYEIAGKAGFRDTGEARPMLTLPLLAKMSSAALAAGIGRLAAAAGKATAQDFAAGLSAAARETDPLARLSALAGLFLTKKAGEGVVAR